MRSNVRSVLFNATLVLASVIFALLLFEIGLLITDFSYPDFYRPDDRLGIRLRPNSEGWFRSEGEAFVRVNSAGFRDRERSLAKPAGTFRIAVLGDSMIEALQVDLEKTLAAVLERQLGSCGAFGSKKIEVLNFGTSGYGTAQELLLYRYLASKYSPDLVLLAFFPGNDVRNNSKALEPEKVRPFFTLNDGKLIEDRSFATSVEFQRRTNLLRLLLEKLRVLRVVQAMYFIRDRVQMPGATTPSAAAGQGVEAGIDDAVYLEPTSPQWRDAWAVTSRLLAEMRDEVQASGAKLVILTLSNGVQDHPDPAVREAFTRALGIKDIFYPNRRIEEIASKLGVQTISIGPRFQEVAVREKVFFHGFPNTGMGKGHWNEAGNRMAAQVISEVLCNNAATVALGK